MKIYIIEDEKYSCDAIADFLSEFGYSVNRSYLGLEALKQIENESYDLVMTDFYLPDINGKDLIEKIKKLSPETDIVLFSGQKDIIDSINALEIGIYDFLTKPINLQKLVLLIDELKNKKKEIKKDPLDFLFFEDQKIIQIDEFFHDNKFCLNGLQMGSVGIFSEKTNRIYKKIEKLQAYPEIPVLLEGPTGSGKEILAKYTHYQNKNMKGDFIGINCSLLDKELFNSELFGYEKGAFTSADSNGKDGKLKLAENGTLFLDEITEISFDSQARLLRLIQEREYYKVGGVKKHRVNARIVCATNQDIELLSEKGLFRKDLFYRLNICRIKVPPLAERKEEILPLIFFFLRELNKNLNKNIQGIEAGVLKRLLDYSWPGNVRELKNFLTTLILFLEKPMISLAYFLENSRLKNSAEDQKKLFSINDFHLPENPFDLDELNKTIVRKTLEKFNGNKTKAAEFLGLTRAQLYKRFKID